MTTTRGWRGRRWPSRRWWADVGAAGRAVAAWGVGYAVFGAGCALGGTPLPGAPLFGAAAAGWAVAAVGLAAVAAGAALAAGGPRPALRKVLWGLCGPAGAGAFGLLMDVITLLFGQGVDSGPGTAQHLLAALGTGLLAAAARSGAPAVAPADGDPGDPGDPGGAVPVPGVAPVPSAAPGAVQLTALAGSAAFVPYVAMKLFWASGGTFAGVSGADLHAAAVRNGASGIWLTLESWGLDGTALLAGLGVFLLWGLVRPWGQVFPRWTLPLAGRPVPRWLPLAPALLGVGTLAPYGVVGVGWSALATAGVVEVPRGDFPTAADTLLVAWIGLGAFAVYGTALAVAARSYWRRTARRPGRALPKQQRKLPPARWSAQPGGGGDRRE
ncbi:hypothetical protein ACFXAF_07255 [Kitasatospora sp. NPDC059463]|uniref:hypothetical protein n=2 Tax=unclassified Kitasatospora TaxID=2633591 RepID=UPI0036A3A0E4